MNDLKNDNGLFKSEEFYHHKNVVPQGNNIFISNPKIEDSAIKTKEVVQVKETNAVVGKAVSKKPPSVINTLLIATAASGSATVGAVIAVNAIDVDVSLFSRNTSSLVFEISPRNTKEYDMVLAELSYQDEVIASQEVLEDRFTPFYELQDESEYTLKIYYYQEYFNPEVDQEDKIREPVLKYSSNWSTAAFDQYAHIDIISYTSEGLEFMVYNETRYSFITTRVYTNKETLYVDDYEGKEKHHFVKDLPLDDYIFITVKHDNSGLNYMELEPLFVPTPTVEPTYITPTPTPTITPSPTPTPTPSVTPTPTTVYVEGISISDESIELEIGDTYTLSAQVSPQNATNLEISWTSKNDEVATVRDGVVTAVGVGSTIITATSVDGGFTANCSITVKEKNVSVTGISLDEDEIELELGNNKALTATIEPSNATNKKINWSSSDDSIVSVSNGLLTANDVGTAIITATSDDGGYEATCKVTVISKVSGVSLNFEEYTIEVDESFTLLATIEPENASNKNVTWSSSNEDVLVVTDGVVTGLSEGTAIVTVKTADGGYTATCEVTVNAKTVNVTGVNISDYEDDSEIEVEFGDTMKFIANVEPSNATNQEVRWSSSDESVVSIDQTGMITAEGIGEATITVTTEDGGFTSSIKIIVNERTSDIIPVEGVTLSSNRLDLIEGDTETLTATINPSDATNQKVSWTSSDENVATVTDGVVTAVSAGDAIITVTTDDGSYTDTCSVVVDPKIIPVESIILSQTEAILYLDEDGITLTATINPSNASEQDIIWESSDPDSVSVVDGVITATAMPEENVIITASIGDISASCTVTVLARVQEVSINPAELILEVGETSEVSSEIIPEFASNQTVVFSSSDEDVATVSSSGLVTAIAPGTCEIIVTTEDGGHTASCYVLVRQSVQEIAITNVPEYLYVDSESMTLGCFISPDNASDKTIEWSSSNEDVLTVSSDGTITPMGEAGTATITATANLGDATDTCEIIVYNHATSFTIVNEEGEPVEEQLNIVEGDTKKLSVEFEPNNSYAEVTWSSSNEDNVTVSENGEITAKVAYSEANITATIMVDGEEMSQEIYVWVAGKPTPIPISLNETSIDILEGDTFQLEAIFGEGYEIDGVVWSSDNEDVATVDENGLVTAVSEGFAYIYVNDNENLGYSASCYVGVPSPVELTNNNNEALVVTFNSLFVNKYAGYDFELRDADEETLQTGTVSTTSVSYVDPIYSGIYSVVVYNPDGEVILSREFEIRGLTREQFFAYETDNCKISYDLIELEFELEDYDTESDSMQIFFDSTMLETDQYSIVDNVLSIRAFTELNENQTYNFMIIDGNGTTIVDNNYTTTSMVSVSASTSSLMFSFDSGIISSQPTSYTYVVELVDNNNNNTVFTKEYSLDELQSEVIEDAFIYTGTYTFTLYKTSPLSADRETVITKEVSLEANTRPEYLLEMNQSENLVVTYVSGDVPNIEAATAAPYTITIVNEDIQFNKTVNGNITYDTLTGTFYIDMTADPLAIVSDASEKGDTYLELSEGTYTLIITTSDGVVIYTGSFNIN